MRQISLPAAVHHLQLVALIDSTDKSILDASSLRIISWTLIASGCSRIWEALP
jgi:hypothetical protein